MSNYSVKLTKCGKCQFSSAHLPGGGGARQAGLGVALPVDPAGRGAEGRSGQGQGPPGWVAAAQGRAAGPGDTGGRWGLLGWDRGREAPAPDQMAGMLNY